MNKAGLVLGLGIQGIVLSWLHKLEKNCSCSDDWRREYMKAYSYVAVAMSLFLLAGYQKQMRHPLVLGIGIPAGIVNMYAVLSYIPKLKRERCTCATGDEWRDNFIFWWMAVSVGLTVLLLVLGAGQLARSGVKLSSLRP
jgi:hypothetical protein